MLIFTLQATQFSGFLAKRAGVKTVILPADNRKDWDDLTDLIKAEVDIHFAETYDDVYRIAFSDS